MANGDWKTYLAGALFTVSTGLTGIAYQSVTSDIKDLQTERKEVAADAKSAAIQTALVGAQVERVQQDLKALMASSDKRDEKVEQISRDVADLKFVISQNTKVYRDAMDRWNKQVRKD